VSKIFDALRRAEGQRSESNEFVPEPAPHRGRRELRAAALPDASDLPPDFIRELGILRNSLDITFSTMEKRSILFTSATPGEGTTTVATNFARFLALQGSGQVLVCELNARRPAFTRVFSINGTAGMTDYFSKRIQLKSIVQTVGGNQMDVLHVGAHDPTIIQLHLTQVLPEFLGDAFQLYDTVIIDAPPVISCPETPPMTGMVDGVVLVVQAGRTKREVVLRSMESIANFKGNILGVVLNRKKYYIPEFLYKRI